MTDKEKNMQLYVDMQMVNQQLMQSQKQIQAIEESVNELMIAMQGLEDFKNSKKGSEILVPVCNGIFAKGELKDNDKLTVNIGSDVAVEKSVDEVKDMLNKQVIEMQNAQQRLADNIQELTVKAKDIEDKLSKENV